MSCWSIPVCLQVPWHVPVGGGHYWSLFKVQYVLKASHEHRHGSSWSITHCPCWTQNIFFNKRFLCEKEEMSKGKGNQNGFSEKPQVQLPIHAHSSLRSSYVVCSSGHFTHKFLACDLHSACRQHGSPGLRRRLDDSLNPLCNSILATLFTCRNGVEHVPYSLVCDHSQDCLDSSDEDFCDHPSCSGSEQFECVNKQVSNKIRGFPTRMVHFKHGI